MAQNDNPPARREKALNIRIDADLYEAATEAAKDYGLAVTVRALLRAYARGAIKLPQDDLNRELIVAPRRQRKRRAK